MVSSLISIFNLRRMARMARRLEIKRVKPLFIALPRESVPVNRDESGPRPRAAMPFRSRQKYICPQSINTSILNILYETGRLSIVFLLNLSTGRGAGFWPDSHLFGDLTEKCHLSAKNDGKGGVRIHRPGRRLWGFCTNQALAALYLAMASVSMGPTLNRSPTMP